MKYKALVFLFLAVASPYFGWAAGGSQKAAKSEDGSKNTPAGTAVPNRDPAFRSNFQGQGQVQGQGQGQGPGRPSGQEALTRPLLELIFQVENEINSIPYFLSDSIILDYTKTTQKLEITERGEVIMREITIHNQVHVDKNIPGVLTAISYDDDGRMLLAVDFDENDDSYPLVFCEEGQDRSFRLVHYMMSNQERKILYGETMYDLRISEGDTVPYLQIQFEEIIESYPSVKNMLGRRSAFRHRTNGR